MNKDETGRAPGGEGGVWTERPTISTSRTKCQVPFSEGRRTVSGRIRIGKVQRKSHWHKTNARVTAVLVESRQPVWKHNSGIVIKYVGNLGKYIQCFVDEYNFVGLFDLALLQLCSVPIMHSICSRTRMCLDSCKRGSTPSAVIAVNTGEFRRKE